MLSFLTQSVCVLFIATSWRVTKGTEYFLLARPEVRVLLNPQDNNNPSVKQDKIINRRDQLFGIFWKPAKTLSRFLFFASSTHS